MTLVLAPVSRIASSTLLKTGIRLLNVHCPPLPGVTPDTTGVP
jgi:hypothetical protein